VLHAWQEWAYAPPGSEIVKTQGSAPPPR